MITLISNEGEVHELDVELNKHEVKQLKAEGWDVYMNYRCFRNM